MVRSVLPFWCLILVSAAPWLAPGLVPSASAAELHSQFAVVFFDDPSLLNDFNDNLQVGRQLGYLVQMRRIQTREDELRAKLDIVIGKTQDVLDMRPQKLRFNIQLFPNEAGVRAEYFRNYNQKVDYIAYYSLSRKTMYLSVNRVNLRVFAHEVGHVIVDHFFPVRPPYKIHELMAQYAETHITD